jgi:sulfoxide reductase catalytic subunit YedY
MLIRKRRGWEIPERDVTPESIYLNRRRLMHGFAAGAAGAAAGSFPGGVLAAESRYPASRNDAYTVDRRTTPAKFVTSYNNFFEFGSHKRIADAAQALKVDPWSVVIDGMVEKEQKLGFEDLLAQVDLEERVYRFRCVEAWAMTVPWTGFPMSKLVEIAKPLSKARYIRFETFENPDVASAQKQSWYPWPYTEGVTMDEAMNELAFMVTGAYGKPLPKQNGAPIRVILPWKYGFKSIKSLVRITFTDERPVSFWEEMDSNEYGFWANVNPDVPHPRWSQKTETLLSTDEEVPTRIYNGYGDYVAHLYKDRQNERLFM